MLRQFKILKNPVELLVKDCFPMVPKSPWHWELNNSKPQLDAMPNFEHLGVNLNYRFFFELWRVIQDPDFLWGEKSHVDRGKPICIQQKRILDLLYAVLQVTSTWPDDKVMQQQHLHFRHLTAAQPGCCRRSSKRLMTSTKTAGGMLE